MAQRNAKNNIVLLIIVLLFGILGGVNRAQAQTIHYVGKTGSDSNTCTQALNPSTPKLTIQNMLNSCFTYGVGEAANHIVEVSVGTYVESVQLVGNTNAPKGSSWSAPFTLRAKSGDTVTIKAPYRSSAIYINDLTDQTGPPFYISIEGFIIDGQDTASPICCSNNAIVANFALFTRWISNTWINIHNATAFQGGHSLQFLRNKMNLDNNSSGYAYMVYSNAEDSLIEGNEFANFAVYALHMYNFYGCTPNGATVRYNIFHDFGWAKDCPNDPRCGGSGSQDSSAAVLTCGSNFKVYDNLFYNGATAIDLGRSSYLAPNVAYNNTIYNMSLRSIALTGDGGQQIKNNIFYNPTPPRDGEFLDFSAGSVAVYSNNLCARAGTGCAVVGDPLFVNTGAHDFHLQTGSPAIDRGDCLGAPFDRDYDGNARPSC